MRCTSVCMVLVALVFVTGYVHGAAYTADLSIDRDNGFIMKYCDYKGLKLMRGSRIRDYDDCSKCVCDNDGLSCATFFGIIMVPEESPCTYIIAACKIKWVLKNNEKRRCPKRLIPDYKK